MSGRLLLERRFSGRASELKRIRETLRKAVETEGLSASLVTDLVLAVDEACQNIIRHAYGPGAEGDILLELRREGEALVILLRDFARPVVADAIRSTEPDETRPGGLGVHLMHAVMDEVVLLPAPEAERGNVLRMVKRIQ